jgi:hypothetical protein
MALSTGQLSPEELRNAQQATREAFAARGLEMSNQAIAGEAMARSEAVRQRQAQDIQQSAALNQAYLADLNASRGFATGVYGQDLGAHRLIKMPSCVLLWLTKRLAYSFLWPTNRLSIRLPSLGQCLLMRLRSLVPPPVIKQLSLAHLLRTLLLWLTLNSRLVLLWLTKLPKISLAWLT